MNYDNMNNNQIAALLREKEGKLLSEKQNILNLQSDIQNKLPTLALGGMEDINKILWPYMAVTNRISVIPGQTLSGSIVVTQEAGMVMTHMSRVVYRRIEDVGQPNGYYLQYINPRNNTTSNESLIGDVKLQILDAQSRRKFMQAPIRLDNIGDIENAYRFNAPQYVAPNSQLEMVITNSTVDQTYDVFVMMTGYKIRLEEAQKMLSLQHL